MFGPSPSPSATGRMNRRWPVASPHRPAFSYEVPQREKKPRPTNQILMFMADPPSSRHEDENPDISDEKLHHHLRCRSSNCLADYDALSCGFAEFSSKWRRDSSQVCGGSYKPTVVHNWSIAWQTVTKHGCSRLHTVLSLRLSVAQRVWRSLVST
jgi:hypothetical protein